MMASPYVFQQASTPANSKRKASRISISTPPRKPMPAWNPKLDALGHCYEGELAEEQRKPLARGSAENFLARDQNEAAKDNLISEFKSEDGSSRDAVVANLRLLNEAYQRLIGRPRDTSVRYGKEKLSLGEILPISGDLSRLWQETVENPVADLGKSNAILAQRDELLKERDRSIEQTKAAKREQNLLCQTRDLYLKQRNSMQQERDALSQERDRYRQESEMLKRERDELRQEIEQSRQQRLEENTARMIRQTVLSEVENERDEFYRRCSRYRQERDKARGECNSMSIKSDDCQSRLDDMERELNSVKLQLSSSADTLNANMKLLKRTMYQDKASKAEFDTLKSTHSATVTELQQTRDELRHVIADHGRNLESELRRQRMVLQRTATTQAQGLRMRLDRGHELNVRTLTQTWEHEKAQLVASATADRDAVKLAAEKKEKSYSGALKDHQNRLRLLKETAKEAAARSQETIHDLVLAIAVSRCSNNDMHNAFVRRGRTINNQIDRFQGLEKQLTMLQEDLAISQTKRSRLQMLLHGKEQEQYDLSIANEANIRSLREIQNAHAACEHDQRLQLGRVDRQTFFEDISDLAGTLSGKGMVFKGQESNRDVAVCICVLSGSNEVLCVIKRFGGAFTIWHSRIEDCATFSHAWHRWLCLGGDHQGKPMYLSLTSMEESEEWLRNNLPVRTVSSGEVDTLRRTSQF